MLLRRFTDIYPNELARDMREFFNSLPSRRHSAARASMLSRPALTTVRTAWSLPQRSSKTRVSAEMASRSVASSLGFVGMMTKSVNGQGLVLDEQQERRETDWMREWLETNSWTPL